MVKNRPKIGQKPAIFKNLYMICPTSKTQSNNDFWSQNIYISWYSEHRWLEVVRNCLKKCSKNKNIYLVPLNILELVSHEIFLIRVRLPGGAAIIFAQSWNFELKFFVDNPFMQKINSTGVESHFLPKNETKQPKDCNQNIACC